VGEQVHGLQCGILGKSGTIDVQLLVDEGRVQVADDPSDLLPLGRRRECDVRQVLRRSGGLGQRCREPVERLGRRNATAAIHMTVHKQAAAQTLLSWGQPLPGTLAARQHVDAEVEHTDCFAKKPHMLKPIKLSDLSYTEAGGHKQHLTSGRW